MNINIGAEHEQEWRPYPVDVQSTESGRYVLIDLALIIMGE